MQPPRRLGMAKIKLTKTVADAARPETVPYELRDTIIPGFLLKVTPTGRKIFMLAYVANDGQRRKPAIGQLGEITVDQARGIDQDWGIAGSQDQKLVTPGAYQAQPRIAEGGACVHDNMRGHQ